MRLSSYASVGGAFLGAAALCYVAASFSVDLIEDNSKTGVRRALDKEGITWADADANGLQLFLIGTAPSEALRFKAITTAGTVVDAARVIDQMEVADREALAPPRFSVEILRNDSGISLIGLLPETNGSDAFRSAAQKLVGDGALSDLLETAKYPAPNGWAQSLDFGMNAMRELKRSKISIDAGNVSITAMLESDEDKRRIESKLKRRVPAGVHVAMNLSSPRPVIQPYTLRFVIEDGVTRFDACSADTEDAKEIILAAAKAAGLTAHTDCQIGLGVPSKTWANAAAQSIAAMAKLGGGSVTMTDADIALIADEGTEQALFDRVVGELETSLPEVFALQSTLPVPVDASQGPPEFIATLSPEGQVQLRGRVANELARVTADSYAKARFGSKTVYTAARLDDALPHDWSVRVLAAIEALSLLANGSVTVQPDELRIFGETGNTEAKAKVSQLMADKLGGTADFDIDITYRKKLDPVLGLPTPDECEQQLAEAQVPTKIAFEPGSDTVEAGSKKVLDAIAEILSKCEDIKLEIGGHTDSQGRESMNEQLSQARAQTVFNELTDRNVATARYLVKGYGESTPIADNKTEEGREANRRIEFKLIRPKPAPEDTTTLDRLSDAKPDAPTEGTAQAGTEGQTDEQN